MSEMSHQLLNAQPYQNHIQEKGPSFLSKLIGGAAPIVGAAAGYLSPAPGGLKTGFDIGSEFAKGWGK
jgi:hypothetical protein